jgi:hypothetical protein
MNGTDVSGFQNQTESGAKISVSLEREEWIALAQCLSKAVGETVNAVPAVMFFQELVCAGITIGEIKGGENG